MTTVGEENIQEQHETTAVDPSIAPKPRAARSDYGADVLRNMEHLVTLTRKSKRPAMVRDLIEKISQADMPEIAALTDELDSALGPAARHAIFQIIAKLDIPIQIRLEHAAERIVLLDDEYGTQAVRSLLDEQREDDAVMLDGSADSYSQALYLYLEQEFGESTVKKSQARLDYAEHLQVMHRRWKSENFSSHYLGPKGVIPTVDDQIKAALRDRIAAIFPQVLPEHILIESFTRRDLTRLDVDEDDDAEASGVLHTLTAVFNGTTAHFKQVDQGEVIDHEEPAAMSASFSWDSENGALSVFCEDRECRRDLATTFRDVVLASTGDISDMPMREFDLLGFSTAEMLKRLEQERIDGIEKIDIQQIKITQPFEQRNYDASRGRERVLQLSSSLTITRDRRDSRNIYQVAYEDYEIEDLSAYVLAQVKLSVRIAKQAHRKAHQVTVQITSPNGLNDRSKAEDDRKRVMAQLKQLGVLRDF